MENDKDLRMRPKHVRIYRPNREHKAFLRNTCSSDEPQHV